MQSMSYVKHLVIVLYRMVTVSPEHRIETDQVTTMTHPQVWDRAEPCGHIAQSLMGRNVSPHLGVNLQEWYPAWSSKIYGDGGTRHTRHGQSEHRCVVLRDHGAPEPYRTEQGLGPSTGG
jgi:hypothetical protein